MISTRRQFLAATAGIAITSTQTPANDPEAKEPQRPLFFVPEHPFHSRKGIQELLKKPIFTLPWDFVIASGFSIKEKYESLTGMLEACMQILHAGGKKFTSFSMLTSPIISSIFETIDPFNAYDENHMKEYDNWNIIKVGRLKQSDIALYRDALLQPENQIIVRADVPEKVDATEKFWFADEYVRIDVINFII